MPLRSILAILAGTVVTLLLYGYQFGGSNHTAYLLDAMRQIDPSLLANDWFTTRTLQYHSLFTQLGALLMRLGIIEPAFLVLYLALVVSFHIAWCGLIRAIGGDDAAYLVSVVLYSLCAAGTGLVAARGGRRARRCRGGAIGALGEVGPDGARVDRGGGVERGRRRGQGIGGLGPIGGAAADDAGAQGQAHGGGAEDPGRASAPAPTGGAGGAGGANAGGAGAGGGSGGWMRV